MLGANYRAIQIKNTHAPLGILAFVYRRSIMADMLAHSNIASEAEGLKRFLALEIVI